MSFLLMVPEAASPSGPPSSKMSRTSAPVAIVPEGGAPRGQGSVPEEGPGSDQGAEPLQPKSSRGKEAGRKEEGSPGQVRVLPVSHHLGLPNSPICLLSPSTSAPGTPPHRALPLLLSQQSRGQKLPVVRIRQATDRNTSGLCLVEMEPFGNPA